MNPDFTFTNFFSARCGQVQAKSCNEGQTSVEVDQNPVCDDMLACPVNTSS